jgi:hypothetical protein
MADAVVQDSGAVLLQEPYRTTSRLGLDDWISSRLDEDM